LLLVLSGGFLGALHADLAEAEEKISRATDSLVEIAPGAGCIEFTEELSKLYNNDALGAFVLDTEHRTALQEKHFRKTEEYQAHEKLLQAFRKRMESEFYCISLLSSQYDLKRKAFPIKTDEYSVFDRIVPPQRVSGLVMNLPGAKRVTEGPVLYHYAAFVSVAETEALAIEDDRTAKIYARFRLKGLLKTPYRDPDDLTGGGTPLLHFSANHSIDAQFIDYKIISKENGRVYK